MSSWNLWNCDGKEPEPRNGLYGETGSQMRFVQGSARPLERRFLHIHPTKRHVFLCGLTAGGQHGNLSVGANLAQLVEQVIRNDQVVGSSPTIGSTPSKPPILALSFTPALTPYFWFLPPPEHPATPKLRPLKHQY